MKLTRRQLKNIIENNLIFELKEPAEWKAKTYPGLKGKKIPKIKTANLFKKISTKVAKKGIGHLVPWLLPIALYDDYQDVVNLYDWIIYHKNNENKPKDDAPLAYGPGIVRERPNFAWIEKQDFANDIETDLNHFLKLEEVLGPNIILTPKGNPISSKALAELLEQLPDSKPDFKEEERNKKCKNGNPPGPLGCVAWPEERGISKDNDKTDEVLEELILDAIHFHVIKNIPFGESITSILKPIINSELYSKILKRYSSGLAFRGQRKISQSDFKKIFKTPLRKPTQVELDRGYYTIDLKDKPAYWDPSKNTGKESIRKAGHLHKGGKRSTRGITYHQVNGVHIGATLPNGTLDAGSWSPSIQTAYKFSTFTHGSTPYIENKFKNGANIILTANANNSDNFFFDIRPFYDMPHGSTNAFKYDNEVAQLGRVKIDKVTVLLRPRVIPAENELSSNEDDNIMQKIKRYFGY